MMTESPHAEALIAQPPAQGYILVHRFEDLAPVPKPWHADRDFRTIERVKRLLMMQLCLDEPRAYRCLQRTAMSFRQRMDRLAQRALNGRVPLWLFVNWGRVMPLKQGSSDQVIQRNIQEMMQSYKETGLIGQVRPDNEEHAKKIAAAAAYSKARERQGRDRKN